MRRLHLSYKFMRAMKDDLLIFDVFDILLHVYVLFFILYLSTSSAKPASSMR